MKYLITGGGTGGHIYPALAIANEIKNKDKHAKILYVGTEKGLESELVPKEGFQFRTIRVKGMPRKINKESFIALKELFHGINDAKKIINEFKPDVVIGTGGYVCGPVVYIAKKKKIPAMIHEQNAFPGITNKILSRYVDKVAVTFDEAKKYFKYPDRVINTGNPIRKEILNINKEEAYKALNIDKSVPFILSFGGSGGQKTLNDGIYSLIKEAVDKKDIQIIHVTGKRFYDEFIDRLKRDNIKLNNNIKIFPYFYQIPEAINIASLVVTSSGAITLAEISAVGVPSVLIPKSYTAENHQEFNARAFENKGASILVLEKDIRGNILNDIIYDLIKDKNRLEEMAKNSKKLGKIDASEKIFEIINTIVK
ncbi:UDP-N-acetylglucosamine-N-acetylmuramylpentapeptide N-acetylglucosamine transferase [Tissierella praeacuta DSM 18095]|uniref:UDP-N-acetylglucosamine--N-acetylmuramyl-(pentapeptide) pyrophosphoryl-undecaprenol N-acetylglucosamine transferase n=1 Tax=Tissierella praeacuta DSM 18095 TaxID=1123404 RepID=A0A1M4SUG0_9FIRM|nr:undecaprenyldiphospho-muramoylpentapeptide beta-N-acetylglucosaminyltransferase [Tissierella praeacuta]SHE35853.1 UDP-N-acetylglucosamine-N-acetylmuramylpentapeptide N-acetylglucosamine transferase [Tissierella praeacuta DSM 18095]SUP01776.1 UDP-N-acetylglucosamine--N-acetylmuramyl-(pentapeptide) pyrophosphoryl-undecaprenol N-acetylglucosamine transferase [Tissierella praeacuta]